VSDPLQFADSPIRPLRLEEHELICYLLSRVPSGDIVMHGLSGCLVIDLEDGGMGSIRFICPLPQSMGKELIEAKYFDSDGVLVSITLNLDKEGNLYEVDFWKVDFSPLLRYPNPSDLLVST
jgi:hypothetical protein